jgi:Secretion system C-terminal sorting domain
LRIQLFPNPANGEFNFGLPGEIHPESHWEIIDQRGVSVLQGDFTKATNGLLQVNVSDLSNAMYYVVIDGPGGITVRKKLMVMNRN